MPRKKAKAKQAVAIDTALGEQAYALATAHGAALDPRLPMGTIDTLGADLKMLGVSLVSASPAAESLPVPQPPSLAEALTTATNLVTAIHDAVRGAKPKPEIRKAYGVGSKEVSKEMKLVLAAAEKIVAQATADTSEALALGILPADLTALTQAVAALKAAETPTGREKRAMVTRILASVERIAGAGTLSFAQDAAVRAQFEALRPKKKV